MDLPLIWQPLGQFAARFVCVALRKSSTVYSVKGDQFLHHLEANSARRIKRRGECQGPTCRLHGNLGYSHLSMSALAIMHQLKTGSFPVGGKHTGYRQNDAWVVSTISEWAFLGDWAMSMTMSVMSSC
jgi:hypothetical protein